MNRLPAARYSGTTSVPVRMPMIVASTPSSTPAGPTRCRAATAPAAAASATESRPTPGKSGVSPASGRMGNAVCGVVRRIRRQYARARSPAARPGADLSYAARASGCQPATAGSASSSRSRSRNSRRSTEHPQASTARWENTNTTWRGRPPATTTLTRSGHSSWCRNGFPQSRSAASSASRRTRPGSVSRNSTGRSPAASRHCRGSPSGPTGNRVRSASWRRTRACRAVSTRSRVAVGGRCTRNRMLR